MAAQKDQKKVIKQEITIKVNTKPQQILCKRVSSYQSNVDIKDEEYDEEDFGIEKDEYYSEVENSEVRVKEEEQMWGNAGQQEPQKQ